MSEIKELSNLIADMVRDPKLAQQVIENPGIYQEEYNLTPRNVEALRNANYDELSKGVPTLAGGCYYGG